MAELRLFGMRWRDETPNWSLGLDSMFRAEKTKISLINEKKRESDFDGSFASDGK